MPCSCHNQWGKTCIPQYNGACPSHICKENMGGPHGVPRTRTNWAEKITETTYVKLSHIDEMRAALNVETSVRTLTQSNWSNPTQYFSSTQYVQIKDTIDRCRKEDKKSDFTYRDSYEPEEIITRLGTIYLREYINLLQDHCVCQCHFDCHCNCDYCTCHCDYCVCQCAWWCPCQCAY